METVLNILKIVAATFLFLFGFSLSKAFSSTGKELRLYGKQTYAQGYKLRRFFLFLFGYGSIIFSLYIFYTLSRGRGLMLFFITLVLNVISQAVVRRFREVYE